MTKHGLSSHPLYNVWAEMKRRCYDPKNKDYKNWGGREIRMCAEWYFYPQNFIKWAMSNGWKKGLVIDRINNDTNYCPKNCRFLTRAKSNQNVQLMRSTNKSGYRGVSWNKRHKKWYACIRINSKTKYLGNFDSPRLAAIRYDVEAFLTDNRPCNFILNP